MYIFKLCWRLAYSTFNQLLVVSISAFASFVDIPGITRSKVGINICAMNESMIKKKKNMHDKIVLIGKHQLNTINILISKFLFDSYISHDELVSVNNVFVLLEYEMKNEIKNPETSVKCII